MDCGEEKRHCGLQTDSVVGNGRYVELEGEGAMHMKATLVEQGTRSSYALTEARLGGRLSRQDISILQVFFPPHLSFSHRLFLIT